ncbi:MAG: HpcH/HpaI aldolase/citrate lyase family protein [Acidimicrobiales bacterium]
MRENTLKSSWNAGEATLGLWLSSPDPIGAEQLAAIDFDYICVDLQHGLIGYDSSLPLLQAVRHGTAIPICRAPWNEPGIIGKLLDAGAMGIVVPMVNSAAEAEQAVRACRYAPVGARSFGPARAAAVHGADYASEANAQIACIPMIETVEALGNLDAILDVPGIDAVYVGPADLSISLGLPPGVDNDDPSFVEAIDAILAATAARGIAAGIHSAPSVAPKRVEQGFTMVTVTSDLQALGTGARAGLKEARGGGDEASSKKMY